MAATSGSFAKGPDSRRFGGGRSPSPRVTLPDGKHRTLAEIAREGTWDAVQVLRECVNDKSEEMATRIRAAGYILTLGWGDAPKEATLRLASDRTGASMSDAELIALARERFGKLRASSSPPVIDAGDKAAD